MDPLQHDLALLSWSNDLIVTSATGATARVLGNAPAGLVGKPLEVALQIRPEDAKRLAAGAAAPDGEARAQFVRLKGDDERTWLRVVAQRVGDQVQALVMNLERLLEGAPPLQISRLSSSLCHELRNPLSSVKMAVQTLARNAGLSERDQRRLVIANREVRTMERMLWLFSEYGRDTPPHKEEVLLRQLVDEAAALVQPELQERRMQLQLHADEAAQKARVNVDLARLRPVLAQLLLNVAVGQGEGSGLPVRLLAADGKPRIVLEDPSAHLPDEERATVFEPFASMLARGAGLSLATLYRVMKSHGGEVEASALPGGGTVYTLCFLV